MYACRTKNTIVILAVAAAAATTGLVILLRSPGRQLGVTGAQNSQAQDVNDKPRPRAEGYAKMPAETAKRVLAEFATSAKCVWLEGISRPQLPELTPDVGRALQSLEGNVDRDSLAAIAAILVRFATENKRCCGFGTPVNPDHPLTRAFMSATNAELPGDEIISTWLADWVCAHRGELGKSQTLDEEIEGFQAAVQEQSLR